MKLRSYAPALIAIVGLVVVYLWMRGRGEQEPAKSPPATPVAATDSTARPTAAPVGSPATPRSADRVTPPPAPPAGVRAPTEPPTLGSEEEHVAHEPKAKLPKLTLEERIAAAKEHITVMERRVELMKQEIADLEKAGDKAKADEQRVIMGRLTAHAEKLRKAIAEGREPE